MPRLLFVMFRSALTPVLAGLLCAFLPVATWAAADPGVASLLEQVNPQNLRQTVEAISIPEGRAAGTEGNAKVTRWIHSQLGSLGYATALDCYGSDGECNVVARRPGVVVPAQSVVVVAHFDSVGEPSAGADDNASGVAGLLELARVLSTRRAGTALTFVAVNGEENGLVGSTSWVDRRDPAELAGIRLAVVLDMIGYNRSGILNLETDEPFEGLARWFADKATTYTRLTPKITMPAWGSDHVPFLKKGVPTVLTIEDWDQHTPCYHDPCDTPSSLNYEYAAELVRIDLAAIVEKAQVDLER